MVYSAMFINVHEKLTPGQLGPNGVIPTMFGMFKYLSGWLLSVSSISTLLFIIYQLCVCCMSLSLSVSVMQRYSYAVYLVRILAEEELLAQLRNNSFESVENCRARSEHR